MSEILSWFLTVLGIFVIAWGLARYRRRFVKTDLAISVMFGVGVLAVAWVPTTFDAVGEVFNLETRFVVVSMFANVSLLLFTLYLLGGLQETRRKIREMNRSLSVDQAAIGDPDRKLVQPVIPAYNEEDAIENVIRSLPKTVCEYEVEPIVVSDGSADDTAKRARINGTTVVEHPLNQGQGGALQTGFEIAKLNKADIVVTMDADGQHPADELEQLVRPVVDDEADFVMGSRYLGLDYSGNGPARRAGIRVFTVLINLLTKAGITDCTNGYRAIRGSALEEMTLTEERFSAPELIIEVKKKGLRLKEIPITIEERDAGETKKPQLRYALGLTRTIFVTWLR